MQTEIDGLRGVPPSALETGAAWRWRGKAVRVDGAHRPLRLDEPIGRAELATHASRAARRLLGRAMLPHRVESGPDFGDPVIGPDFSVTDGRRVWTASFLELERAARPLVVFAGGLPPRDVELWVVRGPGDRGRVNCVADSPTGVICFTPGTLLRTPGGDVPVETLAEGDRIETRDGGAQEVVWIGRRKLSGARLFAMPELRPIRIRAGVLGRGDPRGDLVVSPRHRVLVRGTTADDLFGTDEVLVAAEDLLDGRGVARDHSLHEVEYVHLLLPRHHVVWANGVETESFHPASTDLDTVEPGQRARLSAIVPGIEDDPSGYGAPARRQLTRPEAEILRHEGGFGH